ncbi:hypothetical protein NECHADRAFT_94396 [Paecilomyces variotii No. 5]|uniref:Gfo/Idh/MocA-like oxidoreductase N-terminal domain-containing protein n=1 Tax=Byssochlamys spectabilis (strain No. 5 / NBRC 109023) TaxID=1356009 RepID=V5HTA8_BYSSN|nr:hypothetical protein NECHADRAFT_94396 [Paecilomyces variotii No. 5]
MSFQDSVGIFTQEEVDLLEKEDILQPELLTTSTTGKRKVSAVFSLPSDSSISSSSSSSASVKIRDFNPSTTYTFDLPLDPDSVDALEWVGFVPSTAKEIFERYSGRPDPEQCPDSLVDYAFTHIAVLWERQCKNMSLRQAMTYIGINQQIQDAITNPEFSDIFWTQDLHYWVKDTLEMNFATLFSRQKLLKNHAGRRLNRKKKQKRASLQEAFQHDEPAQPQHVTATINMTPQDFRFPAAHIAIDSKSTILADHVVLYKEKGFRDLKIPRTIIENDGSIDLWSLRTTEGGDFNSREQAHYWTPEKDTAERYRKWAALRSPNTETCIIEIQISRDLLDSWKSAELWYSRDWRRYVWLCRQGKRVIDKEYEYLFKPDKVGVVKGHICTGVSEAIMEIREEDVESKMTEDTGHGYSWKDAFRNIWTCSKAVVASQWSVGARRAYDRAEFQPTTHPQNSSPSLTLSKAAQIQLASRLKTAHYRSITDLLSSPHKPDAAIICTPNHTHVPLSKELSSHGIHILIEKPFSTDVPSGKSLLQHLKARPDIKTLVGHHRRFNPYIAPSSPSTGLWTTFKPPSYFSPPAEWRRGRTGGVALINLIHEIDLMHYLFGPIVRVHAEKTLSQRGPDHEAEKGAALTLRFKSGVVGTFIVTDHAPSPYNFESGTGENPLIPKTGMDFYRVFGTEGSLSVPDMNLWSYRGGAQKSWHEELVKETVVVSEEVPFEL